MGLPSVDIAFKTVAISAIQRSQKGTVAVVIRDTKNLGLKILASVTEIPKTLGVENKACLERAFLGYITPPRNLIVYVLPPDGELDLALDSLQTQSFDYLVGPSNATEDECQKIKTWVTSKRLNENAIFKAVLPNLAADNDSIVNFCADEIKTKTGIYHTGEYCSRIAGLLAGTPMTISCTYAPLPEVVDVKRLSRAEMDAAIDRGELHIIHDGEKAKIARGVNSFISPNQDKGEIFKKIKIVETIDMIQQDIRRVSENSYIGKYANSYDNKCLLIMAIKGYLEQLELDGLLEKGYSDVGIDVDAQRVYLTGIGVNTDDMSEQAIKAANTGSKVFLFANIHILDAIEDIGLNIML